MDKTAKAQDPARFSEEVRDHVHNSRINRLFPVKFFNPVVGTALMRPAFLGGC